MENKQTNDPALLCEDPAAQQGEALKPQEEAAPAQEDEQTRQTGHYVFLKNPVSGKLERQGEAPDNPLPESILRFAIDEEQLPELVKRHASSKLLSPIGLTKNMKVEKRYVPFWVFDVKAQGKLYFRIQDYKFSWLSNRVDTYSAEDQGEYILQGIAVDASKDMQDNLMDELEPFDYSKVETYVPGMEDCPVVEADTPLNLCAERVERLSRLACVRETTEDLSELREIIYLTEDKSFDISWMEARLVLLPVYRVTCKAEGKQCVLSVNGQTGEVIGEVHITAYKHIIVGSVTVLAAVFIGWALSFLSRLAMLDTVLIPVALCLIVAFYFLYSLINAADGKRRRFARVFARHISEEDRKKISRRINILRREKYRTSEGPYGLAQNLLLPLRLPIKALVTVFYLFPLAFYISVLGLTLMIGFVDLGKPDSISTLMITIGGIAALCAVLRGCIKEPWYVENIRLGLGGIGEFLSTFDIGSGSFDSDSSSSGSSSGHSSSHSSSGSSSSSSSFGGGHSSGGGAGRR